MANSIYDILNDAWGLHNERKGPGPTVIYYTGLPHKFNRNRLKKTNSFVQRVIAIRFISQIDLATDITEETIF
jgi:hypothetical protein